jgi:hypothetical protein
LFEQDKEGPPRLLFVDATVFAALAFAAVPLPWPFAATVFVAFFLLLSVFEGPFSLFLT